MVWPGPGVTATVKPGTDPSPLCAAATMLPCSSVTNSMVRVSLIARSVSDVAAALNVEVHSAGAPVRHRDPVPVEGILPGTGLRRAVLLDAADGIVKDLRVVGDHQFCRRLSSQRMRHDPLRAMIVTGITEPHVDPHRSARREKEGPTGRLKAVEGHRHHLRLPLR